MLSQGFHQISEREYHALPGPSASRCKAVARSPMYCKAQLDGLLSVSKALIDGRAAHYAMCFPNEFELKYFPFPKRINLTKNEDKAIKEEYVSRYGADFCLQPEDFQMCLRVRDRVWSKSSIREVLEKVSEFESSGLWKHDDSGAVCKMRLDALATPIAIALDFKTTTDASRSAFSWSLAKYKYHWQAAFYMNGLAQLGAKVDSFVFIAIEKAEPFDAALYVLDKDSLARGWEEVEPWIKVYHGCETTGQWPGYPDFAQDISLPNLKFKAEEIDQEEDY